MKTATPTTDRVRKALDVLEERHGPIAPAAAGTPDRIVRTVRRGLRLVTTGIVDGYAYQATASSVSVQGSEWIRG